MKPFPDQTGQLHIDLQALVENWRFLRGRSGVAECAAVVKANGYGLGAGPVARALETAGCRSFYVATLAEAEDLKIRLASPAGIFIFNGVAAAELPVCRREGFIPVLSSPAQVEAWAAANRQEERMLPCMIHVDTGMNRLGLEPPEWRAVCRQQDAATLGVRWIMSHLACAEHPDHPLNREQLQRFRGILAEAREWCPGIAASLANSGGVMLGSDYHFHQTRPGIALYGGNPETGPNRFRPVVTLRLPILQLRRVSEDGSVGYGATVPVRAGRLLATVQGGYADGLLVSQSWRAQGEVAGVSVPMLGRVSMDLSVFDVTHVPAEVWDSPEGGYVEVLNERVTIDHMADAAGTISYEVLTRLGGRYHHYYSGPE